MDRKLFLTIVRYNPKFVMSEFVISGVDCSSKNRNMMTNIYIYTYMIKRGDGLLVEL